MAFSNTPIASTYSSVQLPLAHDLDLYPAQGGIAACAAGMVNILPFKGEKDMIYGETRQCINANTVFSGSQGKCRGMYVWEKTAGTVYYYMVINDGTNTKVYTSTTGLNASWTAVTTLTNNGTTPCRFAEFIDATNVKKLVLVDGIEGYVFTTNAAGTKIVDADFPTPHVPFPVFMDGYLFLAKAGTGDIYNSDLNDPASWTAGSLLSSELYPDDVVALVKVNNYILAIGKEGCEYFYDAAIATASPLARYEGGSLPFGTSFPNTIACNKDTVMLFANNNDGESVFKVIEGFKHTEVPALAVTRALVSQFAGGVVTALTLRACFIRQNTELFYVLNFYGTGGVYPNPTDTVAYAIQAKMWVSLKSDFFAVGTAGGEWNYPVYFSAPSTSGKSVTYVAGHHIYTFGANCAVFFGYLDASLGLETIAGNPSGDVYVYAEAKIPPQTFGTLNRKTMSRLGINVTGNPPVTMNSKIQVRYTDNLYATEPTAGNFPMTLSGAFWGDGGFPFVTQLGSFRQRAFRLSAFGTAGMRWNYIEVDINKGQQ